MQTEYLREFILLSRTLNFSATAKLLHVSQSALSNHIIALEKEFDAQLIDRKESPCLTPAGEVLLQRSQAILQLIDDTKKVIDNEVRIVRASIRIRLPNASNLSTSELLTCVEAFKQEHPEISVLLLPASNNDPIEEIKAGKLEGGMYCMLSSEPADTQCDLRFSPLCDDECIAWIDKESALGKKDILYPNDLQGMSMPIPSKTQTINAEMFVGSFLRHYHIDANMVLTPESSIEDFITHRVSHDDVILLMKSTSYDTTMLTRSERIIRSFQPPVFLTTFYAFSNNEGKLGTNRYKAICMFRDFMRERYLAMQPAHLGEANPAFR